MQTKKELTTYWLQFFIIFYDTKQKEDQIFYSFQRNELQEILNTKGKIGWRQFFIIFYDTNKKEDQIFYSFRRNELQEILKTKIGKLADANFYYILRHKQKESQPLQRDTSPIYTHLTPVKD